MKPRNLSKTLFLINFDILIDILIKITSFNIMILFVFSFYKSIVSYLTLLIKRFKICSF